jgi:hypothetical protein
MSTITLRSVKGIPLTNNEVDNNFTNLNTDKYQSGDNPSFGNLTLTGAFIPSVDATVTAAGTTQGDATALTKAVSIVTTATSNQGVKLPTAAAGISATIVNTTAVTIKVYPNTSDVIDGGTVNVAVYLAPYSSVQLVAQDAIDWFRITNLIVYDTSGNRLN